MRVKPDETRISPNITTLDTGGQLRVFIAVDTTIRGGIQRFRYDGMDTDTLELYIDNSHRAFRVAGKGNIYHISAEQEYHHNGILVISIYANYRE